MLSNCIFILQLQVLSSYIPSIATLGFIMNCVPYMYLTLLETHPCITLTLLLLVVVVLLPLSSPSLDPCDLTFLLMLFLFLLLPLILLLAPDSPYMTHALILSCCYSHLQSIMRFHNTCCASGANEKHGLYELPPPPTVLSAAAGRERMMDRGRK